MVARVIITANYALFIFGCALALMSAAPTAMLSTTFVLTALAAGAAAMFLLTRRG